MSGATGLRWLALSHFRSHRHARLRFDGRPVAIWGANGTGKTNILEAVSLLSPGRGLRGAPAEALARRPEALGWKLTAGLAGRSVATWAEPGRPRSVTIDDKPGPQAALGRLARMLWLTPAMDRLWIEGAEGRRRFLDRMALSFVPAHAETALAYDKAMRERNRLLRDGIADPVWHEALEAQMARSGAALAAHRRLALARLAAADAAVADAAFPVARLDLTGPEGVAPPESEAELARALAEGRRRDMAAGRTLVGPHRADLRAVYVAKEMPAEQCSTGEQKALLIALVLANARALAVDDAAPPILLLDEVAAHLDDNRRAALYEALVRLGAQAFLTGTGPELFAGLRGRAQGVSVAEREGMSVLTEEEVP
ncbi:MAG: DNA replication/repair protein RecF [Alkalilacustris sp.]